jgi:hypothetical protein
MRKNNIVRARWAKDSLARYIRQDPHAEKEQHVGDLLCDLHHFCERYKVDFDVALQRGEAHYCEEKAGHDDSYPLKYK